MFLNLGGGACPVRARTWVFGVALAFFLCLGLHPGHGAEPATKRVYHASVLNGAILGSAFMITDGLVVTNAHVLAGRPTGDTVTLIAPSGRRVTAHIEAVSTQMDLAVMTLKGRHLPVVPPPSKRTTRGSAIVAVGIVASHGRPRQRVLIGGVVSSDNHALEPFGRGIIARMPLVQRGFSGGPVFDRQGGLVGMVAALRPAGVSPSGEREAFILTAADITAEVGRLMAR